MSRVAIATCAGDNVDVDAPILLAALDRIGVAATLCVWDDPAVQWDDFALVVIRSTWDYAPRRDAFLAWARTLHHVANPYEVLAYSTDKHYLADVSAQGFAVVPTTFCEIGETPTFPSGDFVVKPAIGAGSLDAARYGDADHDRARAHVADLHARGRSVLVQPYVASVDTRGEHALIYIDGTWTHAMGKGPMLNTPADERDALFRREQMTRQDADPDAVALATALLATIEADLLYARVDLVWAPSGWQLMELELVEPSLFLTFHPAAGDRLAAAIAARLA